MDKNVEFQDNINMRNCTIIMNEIEKKFKEMNKTQEELKMIEELEKLKEDLKALYQEGSNKELFISKVTEFQILQKKVEFSPRTIGGTTANIVYINDNII